MKSSQMVIVQVRIYKISYMLVTVIIIMAIFEPSFDNAYFGKYLWRKIYNYLLSQKITLLKLEKIIWMKQPHISTLLNWKRTTKNIDQYRLIAVWAWMSEGEFERLVKEARKAEYEHSTGRNTEPVGELSFSAALSKEFWISDKDAISDIKKYIKYVKSNMQ